MYLILIQFIIAVLTTICDGDSICSVFPRDKFIEVGSGTEVTCQSSCVSGKVFWTLNNKSVNRSLSHNINSTHTVLVLPYSELWDSYPTATVQCHSVKIHQVLGGTTIRIYTKPHNLSCIFHSNRRGGGLPELFTCTWEHHISSSLEISYSLMCTDCPADQREICHSDVTYCTSQTTTILSQSQILLLENNTVYVRAKTDAWEAYSDNYTFLYPHIFKIPPRNLSAEVVSDHILVNWDTLPKAGVNGHCQVKYKKDEETIERSLNKTISLGEKGKMTIDKVESCTKYHISVRCALEHAPWSDWSQEKTVLTKLKKTDVNLDVWRQTSELRGKRKVHILWKGIPPNCPDTYRYTVKQSGYNELTSRAEHTETLCGNYSCDITVNEEAQRINLTVIYNKTLLTEDSFYLPGIDESESDSLPRVTDIETQYDEGVLVVRWKAPSQNVSDYVIDWIHDGSQFDWKKTKFTNTTLYGLVDKKAYNITVTPLFGDKTGLSTHVFGICSSFADPGIVTILDVETYDKRAYVRWSINSQDRCSEVIVNYTVFYGTQNGPQFNVTVNNTVQDVYLINLNPDTQYNVHVVATARTQTAKSNERLFKTKQFDPRLITVLSVTGSIIIILVLSLGLCCAVLWRKFNEKPVPNPSLSSLALWPQTTHQKGMCPFELFNTPSESICERIYTEEMPQTLFHPSTLTNPSFICDQSNLTTPLQKCERPALTVRIPHLSNPGESTSMMMTDNIAFSPYRSQTSVESPAPRTSKQVKHLSTKQQEKTPAYVSLNMFEQDQ